MTKRAISLSGLLIGLFFSGPVFFTGCLGEKVTQTTDTVYVFDPLAADSLLGYGKLSYVGSDKCEHCHEIQYQNFLLTGHANMMKRIGGGAPPEYPAFTGNLGLPEGLSWDQVSYVIGGYAWKALFLDLNGYIYTTGGGNQFNVDDSTFTAYHQDSLMKYDCGECHSTGYDSTGGPQDGLPGIVGSWKEAGVQCEACHGAGSYHVASEGLVPMRVDRSSDACGKCHSRGDGKILPIEGGYMQNHTQYNELMNSKKATMDCVDCHDPHSSVRYDNSASGTGIHTGCETCHQETAEHFDWYDLHDGIVPGCESCHMPQIGLSAKAFSEFIGDVKTHLFRIKADSTEFQWNQDSTGSRPYISVDFGCMQNCHFAGRGYLTDIARGTHSVDTLYH
ncbi:cytochrome c3 family protein [Fibrobacterota bacterium]